MKFEQNIYDKVKKWWQNQFQPYDQDWNSRYELHENGQCKIFLFSKNAMLCNCGVVKLVNKKK
jgi:hypothetical protein